MRKLAGIYYTIFSYNFLISKYSSGALKEEYDRLKQQMQKAQEEINFAYQKKKGINAERKEARLEKEEADKYARLKDDLVSSNKFFLYFSMNLLCLCSGGNTFK